MNETLALSAVALAALALALPAARRRLQLSAAKHPSLTGHARMAKRVAALLPGYAYDAERFFNSDGAPAEAVSRRRQALLRLSTLFATRHARSLALTRETAEGLSDLQFTGAYRVPFQYSPYLRSQLSVPGFVQRVDDMVITDLDGNRLHDLTGSYGVNLFGHAFYQRVMAEGARRAHDHGVLLDSYHPAVADNVRRLKAISRLDEVSFHMSGTEAVMQAVRLARYHTKRTHLVRFCGAYHGWWEDVQSGTGNPVKPRDTDTLKEMDAHTLRVLRTRNDIACVLVNPLQRVHPNSAAPGDSALVDSSRSAGFDRAAYTAWLQQLRTVCTERGIVLIFDEVFMGFRLAPGGAQAYFGVRADMVTYGKTLGGGLPVGVVCGKRALMKRWREDRPADICSARGTFVAHPQVMCAMQVFLEQLDTPAVQAMYDGMDERWAARLARLNSLLLAADLPVQLAGMGTVWTVFYTQPARYNWMLQFYLRAHGLALSWVGTGRLVFSLDHDDDMFEAVAQRFVAACREMREDGWWWADPRSSNLAIRRGILRELLAHRF